MADRESDDVNDIDEGTYVYHMKQVDKYIPRDYLGVVTRKASSGKRAVMFELEFSRTYHAYDLNVSDIQKGTFVHLSEEVSKLGVVTGLEKGLLQASFNGEDVGELKPKALIRCAVQPGTLVLWCQADDAIPSGHVGQVLPELEEGKVMVKFPKEKRSFEPSSLIRCQIQLGDIVQPYVQLEDMFDAERGHVLSLNGDNMFEVEFAKGLGHYKPAALRRDDIQVGKIVKLFKDGDEWELGEITKYQVSYREFFVRIASERYTQHFAPEKFKLHRLQAGKYVLWQKKDSDIPQGDIGEVVRLYDGRVRVQWPQGAWGMKAAELAVLPFQKNDLVQWMGSDDDVPEGDVGTVVHINYAEGRGCQLLVQFPKAMKALTPDDIKPCSVSAAALNRVKTTFKRLDKNGDGKLSQDEILGVLKTIGGEGSMSAEESAQLFQAIDKDSSGKVTVDEFLEYLFASDEAPHKQLLLQGFGHSSLVGFTGEEDADFDFMTYKDIERRAQMAAGPPEPRMSSTGAGLEPIDSDRYGETVSREEWASTMLALGICRQAALESYDACQEDLGGEPCLRELACELKGSGTSAEAEDLLAVLQLVKDGAVNTVDLSVPDDEVDFERELAKKTGIDGLLFYLHYQDKPLSSAADELANAKLSVLETKVLSDLSADELSEAVTEASKKGCTLSAVSSLHRARENCRREVQEIIERCKSDGSKFTDADFDVLGDEPAVLYMDKKQRAYASKMTPPPGWKRAQEIRPEGTLLLENAMASDVVQGRIGTCYLLGALGAMAMRRKNFLKRAFVAYDFETGVYGIVLWKDSHWTYVIVDDYLAVNEDGSFLFGRCQNLDELWVPILEKVFAKYLHCFENLDGGYPDMAVQAFLGGLFGEYEVSRSERMFPKNWFSLVKQSLDNGEVLNQTFMTPDTDSWENLEDVVDVMDWTNRADSGLYFNHAYSVLGAKEVDGNQLVHFRNPHGHGEWKKDWSDKSELWTDELREAFGAKDLNNGEFWMCAGDLVQVSEYLFFNRTLGPSWQRATLYGRFQEDAITVRATATYTARRSDELSMTAGDLIEPNGTMRGMWGSGKNLTRGGAGLFLNELVDLHSLEVFACELSVTDVDENVPLILAVIRENLQVMRTYRVLESGRPFPLMRNYKWVWFFVYDCDGKRVNCEGNGMVKYTYIHDVLYFTKLDPAKAPYSLYLTCPRGGHHFAVCGLVAKGRVQLERLDCSYHDFWVKVYN